MELIEAKRFFAFFITDAWLYKIDVKHLTLVKLWLHRKTSMIQA